MSLIDHYGPDWFNSKFQNSFFKHEDESYVVQRASSSRVSCLKLMLEGDAIVTTSSTLPKDAFTSIGKFAVPMLGWRHGYNGKYLAYLGRNNNSYARGLSLRNIREEKSSITLLIENASRFQRGEYYSAYVALNPEFYTLAEGIQKMRNKEILSFAVSPTIAVIPSTNDEYTIMFKRKQGGIIRADNSLAFNIPELALYMEQPE